MPDKNIPGGKRPAAEPQAGIGGAGAAPRPRSRWRRRRAPVVPPNPFREIQRVAYSEVAQFDPYHALLTVGWVGFFVVMALGYVGFNLVFGLLFMLQPGSIVDAHPGSFADAFFFSVQTMATVGYGYMRPATFYANLLVTFEILVEMAWLAVATGLIFARFSRPTAQILFSRRAVVTLHEGVPTLMFRAANTRRSQILEANVSVMLMRDETTGEGQPIRRFYDLALVRAHTPMFVLTWQVMHPIDTSSPLYGVTQQSLIDANAAIVITLSGVEETFSQTVHARWVYEATQVAWNERFVDILGWNEEGKRFIDYHRFHDTAPSQE